LQGGSGTACRVGGARASPTDSGNRLHPLRLTLLVIAVPRSCVFRAPFQRVVPHGREVPNNGARPLRRGEDHRFVAMALM